MSTTPRRITADCKSPPLVWIHVRPEFACGYKSSWSNDDHFPIGAGMDAPTFLPAGSCYALNDRVHQRWCMRDGF